jgi:phosphate starvation-inducible PhoH-like protein
VNPSRVVVIDDASVMRDLVGAGDGVLKEIEREFPDVEILVRGNTIGLTGAPEAVADVVAAIDELRAIAEAGVEVTPDLARRSVRMLRQEGSEPTKRKVAGGRNAVADQDRPVAVLTRSILSNRGRTIRPKTKNQAIYVSAIESHTVTFAIGPAGTGKTYLAMAQAVAALQAKRVTRIVLTRPAVEAGERLGFLPGTLSEKIDPYLRPLYDALHDMIAPESIPRLIEAGIIEVAPLAYMRGRTLNDAFIILDEAQNTTREQMKMFLTRLGFGSRMVVTGDITQADLPAGMDSGLVVAREILDGIDDIAVCWLTADDVVRHRLVADIITAYAKDDARRGKAAARTSAAHRAKGRPTHD